jgi:hypothetical protein
LLGPDVFWTSIDNQPWSKVAGIRRKLRGCRKGTPDVIVLAKRKLIALELKSLVGQVNDAQREVALQIQRAGGKYWVCRTVRSALVALHRSKVELRTRTGRRWNPPKLPAWEKPVSDLDRPVIWHDAVLARWRADRRRSLARQRERKAAAERTGVDLPTPAREPAPAMPRPVLRQGRDVPSAPKPVLRQPSELAAERYRHGVSPARVTTAKGDAGTVREVPVPQ